MIKILFVCHGNICRSPMAEFVMKDIVSRNGLEDDFDIDSCAATTEDIGSYMHRGAVKKLKEKGIPFEDRKARLFNKKDYETADYIIIMDEENEEDLNYYTNDDPLCKIHYLLEYTGENREVRDPWWTGNFEETYDDISRGCLALLDYIQDNNES